MFIRCWHKEMLMEEKMNRRDFLKRAGRGAVALGVTGCVASEADRISTSRLRKRPNIVLIMSDDMGYSDIGCYGSEISTPNLDTLAANGLRFTQFYNTARCCPTRASLLTGLYPHQTGVGWMMQDQDRPGYRGHLNNNCVTIAEALKPAGYATYVCGKWHVAPTTDRHKSHWPLQRGFDKFYGTIHGAGSFYDPCTLTRGNDFISPFNDPQYEPGTFYYTDAISDHAVRFIREHQSSNARRPFFLYVAYTAAHWPMHALPEDIAKYKGRYDAGYEPIRKARFNRMKQLGVLREDRQLSPQAGDWDSVQDKKWEARCMEVYAAMIDRMDRGIGQIVDELKRQALLDNTLIFFLQDNGGCAEGLGRREEHQKRPDKPTLAPRDPAAIQTEMIPRQTLAGYPVRKGKGVMPGPADTYIAYGQAWANVSNTPFRLYKHWVHEGGIATPLIVHWPARVKAAGEIRQDACHLIDIMATCVDVAGASYPEEHNNHNITPMEGRSLLPVLDGRPIGKRALFWEHERNCAVRYGKWKLVAKKGIRDNEVLPAKWELYDISRDRAELNDLSTRHPQRVQQMLALWKEWAERANVFPRP